MNLPQLLSTRPQGVVLSPSQIDVFDLCKRKWAFQYILGIRPPPHPSAVFGSEVHQHLERWLKAAVPPPHDNQSGRLALKMLTHLPPPGTGAVEKKAFFTTDRGHHYTFVIDWTGIFNQRPTVIDHKTTSNLEYAKTEESLLTDAQGIIYSVAGFAGFQTDEVDLFWNYGTTGKRTDTRHVKTTVHLPIISKNFEVIEEVAAEMLLAYQNIGDPHELPPTPGACGAFGGCPFQSRCQLTDEERIRGIMSNEGSGITMAERMRQQAATQAIGGGGNGVPMQAVPQGGFSTGDVPYPSSVQQPWPAPAAFNPEGGPNPPESGQSIPQAAPAAPPAEGEGRRRGRGPNKAKSGTGGDDKVAFMLGVHAALSGGPQSVEVLVQAGDLALAAFKAKFG